MKNDYAQLAKNGEVLSWINVNLKNYLNKSPKVVENQSEIEHIIDFLNSDNAPRRLRKMSYKEANEAAERWVKSMIRKGSKLEDVEDVDYDVVIDFNDGFKLVKLKTKLAYKREGSLMAHCVSSYFDTKNSSIYSLRDSRNMPHCTMEIPEDVTVIIQCKGKGNGPIHHKYIDYILKTFSHFKLPVRDSEMQHLGYFNPLSSGADKDQVKWFKKTFKNCPYIIMSGVKYWYSRGLNV